MILRCHSFLITDIMIYKLLTTFLGIFFIGFVNGQTKLPIIASAQYKVVYIKNNKTMISDVCQLDLTKTGSYFFSTGELENLRRIKEQYTKSKSSGSPLAMSYGDYLHQLCPFKVFKNYNSNKAYYIQDLNSQNVGFIVDTLTQSRWKIQSETLKINNLVCHKAVMKKDTITITAWFSTEIPFRDGPNYFYGLPGLILKATTSSGFNIDFISLKYNNDAKKYLEVPSYSIVSSSQMQRAMRNQDASFRRGQLPNGGEIKKNPNN
jgi:GLPGLI family protein